MTPKQKANELYEKIYLTLPNKVNNKVSDFTARELAQILVNELIKETGSKYWYEVKKEIINLQAYFMKQKQPDPIIETIFETEKRLKRKANVILKEAKETEAVKLKNGFHWVIIDRKTTVLRKIKK